MTISARRRPSLTLTPRHLTGHLPVAMYTGTTAAHASARRGLVVLTGGFTINYLRPAAGVVLRAVATVVHASRRQATCTCELSVVDEDGVTTLCAIAQGTVIAVRG